MRRSGLRVLFLCLPGLAGCGAASEVAATPEPSQSVITISAPEGETAAVVQPSDIRQSIDAGLAWCTAPAPDEMRSSVDLSPVTTLHIYSGRCVPSDHYYRACDDAGMPIYVPPCGDEDTGTRLEVTTNGQVTVSVGAHAIELVPGNGPGSSWAIGPNGRALVAKVQSKIGGTLRDSVRVVATAYTADGWQAPSEEFSDVVTYPDAHTFTFWRKAVCVDPMGCTVARWEASKGGVHLAPGDKDIYFEARARMRTEMRPAKEAPGCPLPAILTAAKIYAISRLMGDPEKPSLAEFDHLVTGLSTSKCLVTATGRPKHLSAIRQELVKGMKQILAPRAKR